MATHLTILAIFYFLSSLGELLLAATALLFGAGAAVLASNVTTFAFTAGLVTAIAVFFLVLALPGLLEAWGLLARRRWARPLGFVLAILNLFNFPFGTILGLYTIFVLTRREAKLMLER